MAALILCLAFSSFADLAPSRTEQGVIVFVDGKLHAVPFTRGMTLTKAIVAVGGFAEFSRKAISLKRHKRARKVYLLAIIDGRAPDILLEPWDVITIGLPPRASETDY